LLTDMVMPMGMNGLQLAEELRRVRPNIKVVVSSGYSVDLQREGAGASKLSGAVFLAKPFAFDLLRVTLRRTLGGEADSTPASVPTPMR
jgi:CheY-like chemotaxis protein